MSFLPYVVEEALPLLGALEEEAPLLYEGE